MKYALLSEGKSTNLPYPLFALVITECPNDQVPTAGNNIENDVYKSNFHCTKQTLLGQLAKLLYFANIQ